jgi:hypothetical protein
MADGFRHSGIMLLNSLFKIGAVTFVEIIMRSALKHKHKT